MVPRSARSSRLALVALLFALIGCRGLPVRIVAWPTAPNDGSVNGGVGTPTVRLGSAYPVAQVLAAPASGPALIKVGATNAGSFNLASTDFIEMGASTGGVYAGSGLLRLQSTSSSYLPIISVRNFINGADIPLLAYKNDSTADNGSVTVGNATGTTSIVGLIGLGYQVMSATAAAFNDGQSYITNYYQGGTNTLGQVPTTSQSTPGAMFTTNHAGYGVGINATYNGASTILFGPSVTTPTLIQADLATNSGTGAAMTIHSQNETGTTSIGGALAISSGTGTSNPGALNLQVGAVTVDSAQCGVPLAGIGHAGGVNALCTVAQATSATTTRYRVNYLCKATTLYTGGAATDTWFTAVSYAVRNVGGTLTAVAVTTADTELITDTSVSTNAATMSLSGTNVTFNVTPPTVAAGVETCSAAAFVAQTL